MVESATRSNETQLQYDDEIIALHDNIGKGSANVQWIVSGGGIFEQI